MSKGKGQKILALEKDPAKKVKSTVLDRLMAFQVVKVGEDIAIQAGKRQLKLKWSDLKKYHGKRSQRGTLLPKGYQSVVGIKMI